MGIHVLYLVKYYNDQKAAMIAKPDMRDRAEVLLVHPLPAPAFRALGSSGVAARHAAQHAAARPDRQTSWGGEAR